MDNSENGNLGAEALTGAPPPPQEVKVRTMASDLASMTASGGGLPQFQNVKIASASPAPQDAQATVRKSSLLVAILSIVGVVVVLIAGYFAYRAFQKAIAPPSTATPAAGQ
jgi:predicted RND superfamily exporter protein